MPLILSFEERRAEGDISEPGDDPRAPYYDQHKNATALEKVLASILLVDWGDYTE